MSHLPSAIDLTTVADVKEYVKIEGTSGDDLLQMIITGVSRYWLTRTQRASLNSIVSLTERYDGPGGQDLLLREFPIISIASVTVGGAPIPPSPDYIQSGWVINESQDGLALLGSYYFNRGRLNIGVNYQAGFTETPADISDAVIKQVAQNYKRRNTTDQAMVALPSGGGTTAYRSWEVPPDVERVIQNYSKVIPY
jgi:hypothetical protein